MIHTLVVLRRVLLAAVLDADAEAMPMAIKFNL